MFRKIINKALKFSLRSPRPPLRRSLKNIFNKISICDQETIERHLFQIDTIFIRKGP